MTDDTDVSILVRSEKLGPRELGLIAHALEENAESHPEPETRLGCREALDHMGSGLIELSDLSFMFTATGSLMLGLIRQSQVAETVADPDYREVFATTTDAIAGMCDLVASGFGDDDVPA